MTVPQPPQPVPPLLDQDEPPYGIWRAAQIDDRMGYMSWDPYPSNPDGSGRRLRDQGYESGAWWAGAGCSMTWHPGATAPNPMPMPDPGGN